MAADAKVTEADLDAMIAAEKQRRSDLYDALIRAVIGRSATRTIGTLNPAVLARVSARRRILPGMARFEDEDLTDAEFRECDLTRARLIGVVMQDAVIDGLVSNLVVNGVEVTSYVEAELDRRHPVRLLIRSADPPDLREAFRQLRADWAATLGRLLGMPEGSEYQRVGGEWSAVETLRHLVFVHDSWFRRCCLGSTKPFTAIGLAPDFVPDQEEQGLDRAATRASTRCWPCATRRVSSWSVGCRP